MKYLFSKSKWSDTYRIFILTEPDKYRCLMLRYPHERCWREVVSGVHVTIKILVEDYKDIIELYESWDDLLVSKIELFL